MGLLPCSHWNRCVGTRQRSRRTRSATSRYEALLEYLEGRRLPSGFAAGHAPKGPDTSIVAESNQNQSGAPAALQGGQGATSLVAGQSNNGQSNNGQGATSPVASDLGQSNNSEHIQSNNSDHGQSNNGQGATSPVASDHGQSNNSDDRKSDDEERSKDQGGRRIIENDHGA